MKLKLKLKTQKFANRGYGSGKFAKKINAVCEKITFYLIEMFGQKEQVLEYL